MGEVRTRIDGVVIGVLMGFEDGRPTVVFPGNLREAAIPARSLAPLEYASVGSEVALLFEAGDPLKPLIVGRIVDPARAPSPRVVSDGERVRIDAAERLELRCGAATILMEKDGRITIRGARIVSHASGANRIRGGSVHLN